MVFRHRSPDTSPTLLYITLPEFQAPIKIHQFSKGASKPELLFVDDDTKLLFGCQSEFYIWDINTASYLFAFRIPAPSLGFTPPFPRLSNNNDIMVLRQTFTGPFHVVRFSASITVDTVVTHQPTVSVVVFDGQAIFLEVRDNTLWEFNSSAERPLCWLPTPWRRAFESRCIACSGPLLVFGLCGGDIGVLNIDSLRRDCKSPIRARATA